jgi:hypothetical protein
MSELDEYKSALDRFEKAKSILEETADMLKRAADSISKGSFHFAENEKTENDIDEVPNFTVVNWPHAGAIKQLMEAYRKTRDEVDKAYRAIPEATRKLVVAPSNRNRLGSRRA